VSGTYALLFPGQGAQFPGMGERLHERSAAVRELFDRAEDRTGLPLRRLCFEVQRTDQSRTDWTQPAVFVASLAGWVHLREQTSPDTRGPTVTAGHSLGHYTALVAAGALGLDEAIDLVRLRGEIMHRHGSGGMLTIVGLSERQVAELLPSVHSGFAALAAINGPDQIVVAGDEAGLRHIAERAERLGAERVVPLYIGIAAHTSIMARAGAEFSSAIAELPLTEPRIPVALNTTGSITRDPAELRQDLTRHITSPVLWWKTVCTIRAAGVDLLVDAGPGRTLAKVLGRHLPAESVHALDRPRGMDLLLP